MILPDRYTINRVPWGDCACCDSGRCAAHVEHPDRDPPSRPTDAALVEKIERLYVRMLEEHLRRLHETCDRLVYANHRQQDEVQRLKDALDATLPVLPVDAEADAMFDRAQKTFGTPVAPGRRLARVEDVEHAYREGADEMRWRILARVSWGSDLADVIRNEPTPERKS